MAPSSPCGVCHEHESKYKCPICALRYCSLACYKLHKPTHQAEGSSQEPPAFTKTESVVAVSSSSVPISSQHKGPAPSNPIGKGTKSNVGAGRDSGEVGEGDSWEDFAFDPALASLLSRYPLLRVQLQTVYGLTLDPGPEPDPSVSQNEKDGDKDDRAGVPGWHRGGGMRGGIGRGRGRGRGRGYGYRHQPHSESRAGRDEAGSSRSNQRGKWSKERGEREALGLLRRMIRMQRHVRVANEAPDTLSPRDEWVRERSVKEGLLGDGIREFVELCCLRLNNNGPPPVG